MPKSQRWKLKRKVETWNIAIVCRNGDIYSGDCKSDAVIKAWPAHRNMRGQGLVNGSGDVSSSWKKALRTFNCVLRENSALPCNSSSLCLALQKCCFHFSYVLLSLSSPHIFLPVHLPHYTWMFFLSLPAALRSNISLLLSLHQPHFLPFMCSSFPNSVSRFFPLPNFLSSSILSIIFSCLSLITWTTCSLTVRPLPLILLSLPRCFLASILYLFHPVLFSWWGFLRNHCCHSNQIMTPKVFKTSFHRSEGSGFQTVYYCSTIYHSSYTYWACSIRQTCYFVAFFVVAIFVIKVQKKTCPCGDVVFSFLHISCTILQSFKPESIDFSPTWRQQTW